MHARGYEACIEAAPSVWACVSECVFAYMFVCFLECVGVCVGEREVEEKSDRAR